MCSELEHCGLVAYKIVPDERCSEKDSRVTSQQGAELVEFDLAGAVFVDFFDEPFDVDSHAKLVLDGVDQLVGVDAAAAVLVSSHGDVSVHQLIVIVASRNLG